MNRREALIALVGGGVVGGGILFGSTLSGSSDLHIVPAVNGSVVRQDGEQIDSLSHSVTPVENNDALLGISLPDRSTVQTVEVEVVWAIRRDGVWNDVTVELDLIGDGRARLHSGVGTAYRSLWGSTPADAGESASFERQYVYPLGTTAGHVGSLLTVMNSTESAETVIELEAHLSARSLSGTRVELTAPAELTYTFD